MRLIDADSLMETVKALENTVGNYADSFVSMAGHRSIELGRLEDYIESAPTVDTGPVIHASWIEYGYAFNHCSNCGWEWDTPETEESYCPHCGAKMDS